MELTDLHRHLDGSLRLATVRAWAKADGVSIPEPLGFQRGMGLQGALSRFAFTLSLLRAPERVEQVAAEMCGDAAKNGVGVLEIRFAPQLHGPDPAPFVDAAVAGVAGRAGILLCGLYGEDPAVLERLVDLAAERPGVVGIDLAGGPSSGQDFHLADYAAPFARAARLGLGRTVHAAEGRPPEEIRVAVEVLGAQRIGHGTTLLEDPAVLALVLARGVTIEACPTSNVHVGAIASVADHPLPRWLDLGVRACINTDNTLFSEVDAPTEYARARAIPGMDDEKVARCVAFGRAAAFTR